MARTAAGEGGRPVAGVDGSDPAGRGRASGPGSRRSWLAGPDAFWIGGLLALGVLLYSAVVRLWWTYDDPFILRLALTHSWREILFSPKLWQGLPSRMFTPLLLLSFQGDAALFEKATQVVYTKFPQWTPGIFDKVKAALGS